MDELVQKIREYLQKNPGSKARHICRQIGVDKKIVNRCLYANRGIHFLQAGLTPPLWRNIDNSFKTNSDFEIKKIKQNASYATRYRQNKHLKTYPSPLFAQPGEVGKLFGYADRTGKYLLGGPFSIIDLETSDLSPSTGKILEIAIRKVDLDGREIEQFETLINPGDGNVGRTDIHGIDLRMLDGAPHFEDVVGRIFEMIQDSIVVAHHARFEENFLFSELTDSGYDLEPIPALDTLWLAREMANLPDYKLKSVVKAFGKRFDNPHTALGDVVAVSEVLPEMLSRIGGLYFPVTHSRLPDASTPFKAKTR